MSRQRVKNTIALAIFIALLIICSLRSEGQGRGIMVRDAKDAESITADKDLRCEWDLKDGREDGKMRCTGSLKVVWKRGSGRIEVIR